MIVLQASEMGMCFGVRDALTALAEVAEPADVTIHGELVHNREVLTELDRRGFRSSPEHDRQVPKTPTVLVTAHGISERERHRLRAAGKQLVDTTCPLVAKAHDAAQELQAEGRRVVVIGKPGHVEVRGIVGDLSRPLVIADADEVCTWPDDRLGIVCQTTTRIEIAEAIVAAVRRCNPHADVRHIDTICSPTKVRVAALQQLLARVDVLIAVGGKGSNNTRQLAATARRAGILAHHVERADELRPEWFDGCHVVGLTAGTSTLDRTIEQVRDRPESLAQKAGGNGDATDV